ncbi:hypothetical protein [Gracilinema caldarium]|uniref:Uncharacterized protein n=1 Tax=Gracilinema caldarium (strain ATCC 51460 / DSM 7334 / H1) TaxID=744872 RepID=F8F0J6_GRAC1|nr:hypothetical protein [Gracilinema caldarium]AEJ19340.1 hypothetical protein Spica_1194 [Gracilinema caldarium DSM 7334]
MDGTCKDGIIRCEVEGRQVLGFDTGLPPQAFVKARLGNLLNSEGLIVDSTVHPWKPEGTVEHQGHILLYGKNFTGESLEVLLSRGDDTSLLALQWYIKALKHIAEFDSRFFDTISFFPAGVLIHRDGTVFFAPAVLAKRFYEYQDPEYYISKVLRWLHPDKTGINAAVFTAACITYTLVTGCAPFSISRSSELERAQRILNQDIRDGFYKPASLLKPRIDLELTDLLDSILEPVKGKTNRDLEDFIRILGEPGKKKLTDLFNASEAANISTTLLQREFKKRERSIKIQRFFRIYRYVMLAGLGSALALALILWNILEGQKDRPTTKGMTPPEVVKTYYNAFNTLDHQWMEACVQKGVSKGDIEAVINLFVISKVREAYERKATVIDPETWNAEGAKPTDVTIFGITDLSLKVLTPIPIMPVEGEYCSIEATYTFYYPESKMADSIPSESQTIQNQIPSTPKQEIRKDILTLIWSKKSWKITAIDRTLINPQSDIP